MLMVAELAEREPEAHANCMLMASLIRYGESSQSLWSASLRRNRTRQSRYHD